MKNEIRCEQLERVADHAREPRLARAQLLAHRGGLVVVELGQLGLEPGAHRDGPGAARSACSASSGGTSSGSPSATFATYSTGLEVSG